MAKTIAIIGAGGAMGKWFSEYFSKKGFEVTGFDNTNPAVKPKGIQLKNHEFTFGERKRAIKGMHGMQLATAARELGISGPAKATSRSQRIAILKKANKNIRRQRSDFRSFWS